MNIYRFFHPHYNPRLLNVGLRQHELSEGEQVASELLKVLERWQTRCERRPVPPIMALHFKDIIKAMEFVKRSLQTLCDAHPGDSVDDLTGLLNERSGASGWEGWANVLKDQLLSTITETDTQTDQHKETQLKKVVG